MTLTMRPYTIVVAGVEVYERLLPLHMPEVAVGQQDDKIGRKAGHEVR